MFDFIEQKPGSNEYRIVGKGVTVEFLSTLLDNPEWPVDRICANYDLTAAEVYAAWAFYYDHQAEIDARLSAEYSPLPEESVEIEGRRARVQARHAKKTGMQSSDEV